MNLRTPSPHLLAAIGLLTLFPIDARRMLARSDQHPASSPAAAPAVKPTLTVKGEVIDLGCYLSRGLKGAGHAKSAQQCADRGMPVGLLAADGTLYLLTMGMGDPEPFKDARARAGTMITLTGDLHEASGMKALEVKKVEA